MELIEEESFRVLQTYINKTTGQIWYKVFAKDQDGNLQNYNLTPITDSTPLAESGWSGWMAERNGIERVAPDPEWAIDKVERAIEQGRIE